MKCPECGVELSGEDQFCNNCGAAIPASETPEPAPPEELQQVAEDVIPEAEDVADEAESLLEEIEPPPAEEPQPAAAPQPDFAPDPGESSAAPLVTEAKSKPNTVLIIVIIVLVLLALCCCCAMVFLGLYFGLGEETFGVLNQGW
jgi:hypothetical protein